MAIDVLQLINRYGPLGNLFPNIITSEKVYYKRYSSCINSTSHSIINKFNSVKMIYVYKNNVGYIRVLIATIIADLAVVNHALAIGYPSPVENELKDLGLLDSTTFPIFSSLHLFAAAIGSIIISPLSPKFGRKATLMILTFINGISWMLIVLSVNVCMLLAGRVLVGLANGAHTILIPLYITELSPQNTRGFFGSLMFVFLMIGFIIIYSIGIFIGFRQLALFPMLIALIQLFLLYFQPYSPNWLISRGLDTAANNVLKTLRKPEDNTMQEINVLKKIVKETNANLSKKFEQLLRPHYIRAILIFALYTTLSQLFTGTTIIGSYASNAIGSNSLVDPNAAAIFPFVFGIIGSILSSLLTDRLGRKLLTLISGLGLTFFLLSIAVYSNVIKTYFAYCSASSENSEVCKILGIWPMVSLFGIIGFYSFGWGSIGFMLVGEIFHLSIKSIASGVSMFCMHLFGAIPVLVFPYYVSLVGRDYGFLTLSIGTFISTLLIFILLPETKGQTVKEIEELFKGRWFFIDCTRKSVYRIKNTIEKDAIGSVNRRSTRGSVLGDLL